MLMHFTAAVMCCRLVGIGMASRQATVTAVTGEIGNNSFDHNLGNWPNVPGVFFAHNATRRHVILADRGVGIRSTLTRVRPEISSDAEALHIAMTEAVSGRAPENRGNGLGNTPKAAL